MRTSVTTIGAYEAKTKFSELLSRVAAAGAEFVITKHDRPVARLVPAGL
jgi:prevent-host-death family protein